MVRAAVGRDQALAPGDGCVWILLTFDLLNPSLPFSPGPLGPLASPGSVAESPQLRPTSCQGAAGSLNLRPTVLTPLGL